MQQQEYMPRARETAQPLRALTALPEERVGFQASTWRLKTIYNSSSRVSNALFYPLRAPGTHAVHRHSMQAKHPYT